MSCGYIYKIKFPNGKHYIGLTTTSLKRRQEQHKQCANQGDTKCLYNALRKYDMVDLFELIEIDTADTLKELCEKEIRYIEEYNSYYKNGNGYNMTYGGEGTNGYVFTEEDKQKRSEITKKYFKDNPEAGKEHSEIMINYFKNPEVRVKHSDMKKKYYEDNPDARKKISEAQKKYHEDNPDAGKEHSERLKKYYEDNPDAGKEHSERHTKYFENPDVRQKHSESLKKYHEDNPDAGKEHGKVLKTIYENNPEKRQKHSEIKKKYYEENPDARQKLSDGKGKNKQFDVFTVDGTFIKTFAYQFEAREYLQKEHHITSTIKISEVLEGHRKSSAGFVFKYK